MDLSEFPQQMARLYGQLAEQADVDLAAACRHYADACPRCGAQPCACDKERPSHRPTDQGSR